MKYEELVKALRVCGDTETDGCYDCKHQNQFMTCNQLLMLQAADAIEELQRQIDAWVEPERKALIKSLPKWIPVTERLPEEKLNPNTRDFEYVICATIWGDVRPFKYGTPIGSKDAHFWNGAGYVDAYAPIGCRSPRRRRRKHDTTRRTSFRSKAEVG